MMKFSKQIDMNHLLKRNTNDTSKTQSERKISSDTKEPQEKSSQRNKRKDQSKGFETVGDLKCSVCSQELSNTSSMTRHIRDLHTAVEGCLECTKDFCDLMFMTRHEMYIHRDTCIYTCPVCGFIISKNGKAAGHKRRCEDHAKPMSSPSKPPSVKSQWSILSPSKEKLGEANTLLQTSNVQYIFNTAHNPMIKLNIIQSIYNYNLMSYHITNTNII